ncbi:NAD(P)H-binding protein [Chitinophaga oryziterrae]|uniref:NAD(P)H-binding protein n=1 Tax=Chitinophaga oryziterrae TaxID=1031224 RepID=A0A6N8JA60_9BACT|nr:SDR family oxidoreductase [Chitinophaga oryziterrae]MVT42137.1 NAD(P)H-binding protein [Chitinophaga oryziterrae]
MKIVVIGGTGLIGSKLVNKLRQLGHEVTPASPASGVNTITGEGLTDVMKGTDVVVDLANSPSFEDKAVLEFFETSGRNLFAAETRAGVKHHVALSIVGTERLDNGYFRAKLAQERLIKQSGIPYSIVHSTQFFEFLGTIAAAGTVGDEIHLSTGAFQPIASDDVAAAVADVTVGAPLNGIIEIAGPERGRLVDFVKRYLAKKGDPHKVVADVHATYFGSELNDQSIVPGENPRLGKIDFETWFSSQLQKA